MGWIKNLFARKAAKIIADKFGLEDGKMEDGKKWYKSKGVLTGIVTVLIGLYTGIDTQVGPQAGFDLPNIPDLVFVVLGALGIYSRVVASKEIEK